MKKLALAAIVAAAMAPAVQAATIVDTGGNPNGAGWSFGSFQFFAGEFTLGVDTVLTDIEAYLDISNGGDVTVSVHSDGGNVPGGVLYSQDFTVVGGAAEDWYGVSALNWLVSAGTYWVSFTPDASVSGVWSGNAPNPLDEYAQGNSGGWLELGADYFDYLDVGLRIEGEEATAPVPLPAGGLLLIAGLSGLAVTARRRKG